MKQEFDIQFCISRTLSVSSSVFFYFFYSWFPWSINAVSFLSSLSERFPSWDAEWYIPIYYSLLLCLSIHQTAERSLHSALLHSITGFTEVCKCVCVCLTLQCCSSRHSGCVAGGLCCKQTTTPPSHSGSPTARLLVRLSSGSGMASPGSASGSKRNSCKWHLSFFHCWWLKYLLTCSASVIPHGLFVDVCAGKRLLIGISDNSCLLDLDYFVPIWRAEIVGGVL